MKYIFVNKRFTSVTIHIIADSRADAVLAFNACGYNSKDHFGPYLMDEQSEELAMDTELVNHLNER